MASYIQYFATLFTLVTLIRLHNNNMSNFVFYIEHIDIIVEWGVRKYKDKHGKLIRLIKLIESQSLVIIQLLYPVVDGYDWLAVDKDD